MDFSGERFIAEKGLGSEIEIEHLQRYQAILSLVKGKTVLDAASGSGYGTNLLADTAKIAFGIEISNEALRYSQENFARANLHFFQGSINALPFLDNSFDVVISFETIEHVSEPIQEQFVNEIRRVLRDDGVLIISTPDKHIYSDLPDYSNEFHVKEFYRDEFNKFLSSSFNFVQFYDQFCSLAYFLTNHQARTMDIINWEYFNIPGKYIVAVCSSTIFPENLFKNSMVIDIEGKYQKKIDRVVELQGEIIEKNHCITTLEEWQDGCRKTLDAQHELILQKDRELIAKSEDLQSIVGQLAARENELEKERHIEEELLRLQEYICHLQTTKAWRTIQYFYKIKAKFCW